MVAFSACGCRRRTTEKTSRGRRLRHVAASEPPLVGDLPATLELVLGNQIYIAKEGLHPGLRNRLLRLAAFQNPEFYKAQAMRLSTYDKPRVIACAEDHPHHIGLPRGCLDDVRQTLDDLGVRTAIRDERYAGRPSGRELSGRVAARAEGRGRRDAGARHRRAGGHDGVWQDGRRRVAHRTARREHARPRPSASTARSVDRATVDVPRRAGEVDRPHRRRAKPADRACVDVAIIQSLVRKGVVDDRVADYGHLIVDECHHLSAHSFEQVARQAKARFVVGLSATVARKDGHHPIIFMQCGPVRHRVNAQAQAAARPFEHFVLVQPTSFQPSQDVRIRTSASSSRPSIRSWSMTRRATGGSATTWSSPCATGGRRWCSRSGTITSIVSSAGSRSACPSPSRFASRTGQEAATGRSPIGSPPSRGDEARVILATGKYVGEGFDDPRLDTLFLTLPVSWRGTIAQYAGRLHRLYDGKREVRVYDYADLNVPMLGADVRSALPRL